MEVVASFISSLTKRVYHDERCHYAKRIDINNIVEMGVKEAERYGYCACKYCTGIGFQLKTYNKNISKYKEMYCLQIVHEKETDTLYIKSDEGFWKIYFCKKIEQYVLYHFNNFKKDLDVEVAKYGEFHLQKDRKPSDNIDVLIKYIGMHDRALSIMGVDYKLLPHATHKQKKYYKQAKNRKIRNEIRRVEHLFTMLENRI